MGAGGSVQRTAACDANEKARRPQDRLILLLSQTWQESLYNAEREPIPASPCRPQPPSPHPSLAFTQQSLFPAVRIMNLHELIM